MICLHRKWMYLEKPNSEGESKCECMKCGKIKYRKIPVNKNGRDCYAWCDKCENDVFRESYIGDYEDEKVGPVSVFMCDRCKTISVWSFFISMCPQLLESYATSSEEYNEKLKMVEEIKKK